MNFIKKSLITSLAAISLLSTTNSFSMYNKFKGAAKTALPYVCTSVHWYLAAAPFIDEALGRYYTKNRELPLPKAPTEIKQFVEEQLKAVKVSNPQQVQVYMDPRVKEGLVGNTGKALVFGFGDLLTLQMRGEPSKLRTALKDKAMLEKIAKHDADRAQTKLTADQKRELEADREQSEATTEAINACINQYKFVVQQQGVQLRDKRTDIMIAANIAAPFLTHWTIKGIRHIGVAAQLLNPAKPAHGVWRNVLKIPSGYGKAFLTHQAIYAANRKFEAHADNQVAPDMDVLRAGAQFFRDRDAEQRALMSSQMNGATIHPQSPGYKLVEFMADPNHPSKLKRAQRLDERARQIHLKKFETATPPAASDDA